MISFRAYLGAVSLSVEALKFGQIKAVVLNVLRIFLRHFVYVKLHKLNNCEDTSLDHSYLNYKKWRQNNFTAIFGIKDLILN